MKVLASLIVVLLIALGFVTYKAHKRLEAERAACVARGGVLAQERAPPYVCVESK